MDKERLQAVLEKQFSEKYYTSSELQYSNRAAVFLSPREYKELLAYKETKAAEDGIMLRKLPLKAFNSPCLYYSPCCELTEAMSMFISLSLQDQSLADHFAVSFTKSRIYSEIEGSLNIESVPTTRRRLKELLEDDAPAQDVNDVIIKNMKAAIDFVNRRPEFSIENLFTLYSLLSRDSLAEENKLKEGELYRYDSVEISGYKGAPASLIAECMDSLFAFVRTTLKKGEREQLLLLPHICHYYILYVHPYFDFNGRTARMVSYWIYLLSDLEVFAPVVSEAINQTKRKYYQAIELSRDAHNDLTYFLNYIFSVLSDYILCYLNLHHISRTARNRGFVITDTEQSYVKKILITYDGPFTYAGFLKAAGISISKQGALKILNRLIEYGILREMPSSSKSKLFDLEPDAVSYSLKTFGYSLIKR